MKTAALVIAAMLLASTGAAQACTYLGLDCQKIEAYWANIWWTIPPKLYDHPYAGNLEMVRIAVEERFNGDNQPTGAQPDHACKRGLQVALRAGVEDMDRNAQRIRRR